MSASELERRSRTQETTFHRCIWCVVEKPESEFNIEHVMPQAFGRFEQNFTLVHTVCTACNSFFARELEPWLTRDSLEGFDRYRYGQKDATEFKSQGKRSTTRIQLTEGPYAGAWGFTMPSEGRLGVRPFPQVGFAKSAEGPFKWYLVEELPTLDELKAKGYTGNCHLRFCECSDPETIRRLEAKGIKATITETFPPPSGGGWVEQVFRPTVEHRRGLAKIALNYLAHQYGAAFALEEQFNPIRDLVMRGKEPEYTYYTIDEHPILDGDKREGTRVFCHALLVKTSVDGFGVAGTVSLFNRFRHAVLLAQTGGQLMSPRGHLFDILNHKILPLGPTSPR